MDSEILSNLCIFCASPCVTAAHTPPNILNKHSGDQSKCLQINEPNFIGADDHIKNNPSPPPPLSSSSSFFKESSTILSDQLQVIFILKRVLGIEENKLCHFLGKLEGQLHPHLWLKVCKSCERSVQTFLGISKVISKLQKRLNRITAELKGQIYDTRDAHGMSSSVWKEVREEVLKEFPCSTSKPLAVTVPEVVVIDDDDDTNENQDPDFLKIVSPASILPDKADGQDELIINIVENPNPHETIENSVTFISGDISNDEDDDVLIIDESNEFPTPLASTTTSNSIVNAQEHQKLSATLIKNQEPPPPVKKKKNRKINLNDVDVDIDPSSIRIYAFEDLPLSKYPRYTTSAAKNKKYRRYNCLECHYTTSHFKSGMKQHLELHRPDSGAVNCESCGWLIDQYKISRHNATRHPNIPIRSDVIAPPSLHYKCDECDALLSNTGLLEEHEQIHKDGGGEICKMCGWMVKSLKHHNKLWHYSEDRKKDK